MPISREFPVTKDNTGKVTEHTWKGACTIYFDQKNGFNLEPPGNLSAVRIDDMLNNMTKQLFKGSKDDQ